MLARCNNTNCQKSFEVPDQPRDKFEGRSAVRLQTFATCPYCGMMDCHWVYAIDYAPTFIIVVPDHIPEDFRAQYKKNKLRKEFEKWLEEN